MKFDIKDKKIKLLILGAILILGLYAATTHFISKDMHRAENYEVAVSAGGHSIERAIYEIDQVIEDSDIDLSKYEDADNRLDNIKAKIDELRMIANYEEEGEIKSGSEIIIRSVDEKISDVMNERVKLYGNIERSINGLIRSYEKNKEMQKDYKVSEMMEQLIFVNEIVKSDMKKFNNEYVENFNKVVDNITVMPVKESRGWDTVNKIDID